MALTADVAFVRPLVNRLGRDHVHRLVDLAADELDQLPAPEPSAATIVIDLRDARPAPAPPDDLVSEGRER